MRKPNPIQIFITFTVIFAAFVGSIVDWGSLAQLPLEHKVGFVVLLALGLLSEHQAVKTALGEHWGSHSITFIPLSTSVVLFGPAAPALFMCIVGPIGEFVFRRKPPARAVFNSAQYLVATGIAGWMYHALGGQALAPVGQWQWEGLLVPFVAFGLVLLILNQTFVALAISISQKIRFREVVQKVVGRAGGAAAYDLLISPVALIVAFLYIAADGWIGLLLAIFPLYFIRHAYLLNFQLQEANRDLLKALVKAIETRDPYTSGHSLRVQELAGRIAGAMGLPEFRKKNIKQAALLHDIGKIDAVYDEILKKPDRLSETEREVIESHVTKGVELLQSLSSFPKEVVEAVRYHHEREDGKGYPHGLMGSEIPIGAKIINVCDAVDAMLSDRPYRAALSIATVKQELLRYRGVQFDAAVVDVLVDSDLLERHADHVRFEKQVSDGPTHSPRERSQSKSRFGATPD